MNMMMLATIIAIKDMNEEVEYQRMNVWEYGRL